MSRQNLTTEASSLFAGGSRTGSAVSLPPSYHSGLERDHSSDSKEAEVEIRPIQFLKTRATTFGSVTGREIKDKYGKTKRFITRSGTGLPEIQLEDAIRDSEKRRKSFTGWRGGVLAAVTSAGAVLLINIAFTVWAAIRSKSGINIGIFWEAPCETIHTADLWIHIIVNILGTVLLGSSNYTMQCLSSPTRKEVDEAHSVGSYCDIGLPSFRNLRGWKKKSLFALLVASTLPLHFLWNSSVFSTTQKLDHQVYVVTSDFLKSSEVDCSQNSTIQLYTTGYYDYHRVPLEYGISPNSNYSAGMPYGSSSDSWYARDTCKTAKALARNATLGNLQRLSNEECIEAYGPGDSLMSHRGNLLVVTKNKPAGSVNDTILLNFRVEVFVSDMTGNNWVCDPAYLKAHNGKCPWKTLAKTANTSWNMGAIEQIPDAALAGGDKQLPLGEQWPIDYCLSQVTDLGGMCKLQYSLVIMICVIIANIIKFGVILYFLRSTHEPVLATIGDGIATFLERPDPITANSPFLDRAAARKFNLDLAPPSAPYRERTNTLRWWHGPSLTRWLVTLFFCLIAIIATGALLKQASRITNAFGLGFGNYNENAILSLFDANYELSSADFSSNSRLIAMVAVANIPQVLVSCLYFAYNTVYTSMVSADEWSRFTTHRKTLRTTEPQGLQRSTYWLSLPWTYGLPLAAASSLLHWLISQSLFIARTEVLNTEGEPESISYMEVGYSPLAILFALLFGTGMVLIMVANGARKLKGGILVGNNSLAISAACHAPEKDRDAHLKPVKWGALAMQFDDQKEGHCCFTSRDVEPPSVGQVYR